MIVITRKQREALLIGPDIRLQVISIAGDKVRIGIEHPKDATVHRGEVAKALAGQRADSAGTAPTTVGAGEESRLEDVRPSAPRDMPVWKL